MLFTVFTPTYNRSSLLVRLFQSLSKQTVRNFEWLIVDDGSTDGTKELVDHFITIADFPVRYIKQKNQGKHIAINTALENAKGKWYLPIDSDDFISSNCLEICQNLTVEADDSVFGGFTFIHAPEDMAGENKEFGYKRWTDYNSYDWDFPGEMVYVLKMKVIKNYPFPVFDDEKFCQESVQLIPIIKNYKILFTDYILAFGEYLEDGLSQNLYQRLMDNPRYAMLAFKTKLDFAKTSAEKEQLAHNYWDIALKNKKIPWIEKFAGLNLKWTYKVFKNIVMKKLNRYNGCF